MSCSIHISVKFPHLPLMSMDEGCRPQYSHVLRERFSQATAMDGFKKVAYTPLLDTPPGPESHDGDQSSDHHAFSMGGLGAEPPQRKYSMFDLRAAQSQPGRAVFRPKKSRCVKCRYPVPVSMQTSKSKHMCI